jgi:hypothetical protein
LASAADIRCHWSSRSCNTLAIFRHYERLRNALTKHEIASLPDNYLQAQAENYLYVVAAWRHFNNMEIDQRRQSATLRVI